MSLQVERWQGETFRGTVVVSGSNFQEVTSTAAKTAAVNEGSKHLGLCGISGFSGPYPVDEDGNEISDGEKLAALVKSKAQIKYHNDFYISQSLNL